MRVPTSQLRNCCQDRSSTFVKMRQRWSHPRPLLPRSSIESSAATAHRRHRDSQNEFLKLVLALAQRSHSLAENEPCRRSRKRAVDCAGRLAALPRVLSWRALALPHNQRDPLRPRGFQARRNHTDPIRLRRGGQGDFLRIVFNVIYVLIFGWVSSSLTLPLPVSLQSPSSDSRSPGST
ncbi:hypothetical protein BJ742DRAFT_111187 [Cladochytrium replicatum]|nr:hypothetical protein BJ742DRAFT_111187 [Cladochytrium replicatum]